MDQSTTLDVLRPRRLGEQLNFTFSFLRQNARVLVKSTLYFVGPPALFIGIVGGQLILDWVRRTTSYSYYYEGSSGAGSLPTLLAMLVLGMIAAVLQQGVVLGCVKLYRERGHSSFTVNDVWNQVRLDFGRLLGGTIAVGAIFVFMAVLRVGLLAINISFFSALGSLVATIASIYLTIPLAFVVPAAILEDSGVGAAFGRAIKVIKGHWWQTFGLNLALSLIAIYIASVLVTPGMLLSRVLSSLGIASAMSTGSILLTVVSAITVMFVLLTWLLPSLGIALQFFNLVERTDFVGLIARIDSIGSGDADTDTSSINVP